METQLLNLYLFHLINVERLSGNGPQVLIKKKSTVWTIPQ